MPSTRHTPVKTRTAWPPGMRLQYLYIIKRCTRSRVGCVLTLAPAARRSGAAARVDGVQALARKRWLQQLQLRSE